MTFLSKWLIISSTNSILVDGRKSIKKQYDILKYKTFMQHYPNFAAILPLPLSLCSFHSLHTLSLSFITLSLSLIVPLFITILSCYYHVRFLLYELNTSTFIYFFSPSLSIFLGTRADINCTQT